MQKILKKIIICIISAMAVCCACFAAACGNNNSSSNNYTVVVKYADGTAVDGTKDGNSYHYDEDTATESYVSIYVQWCSATEGGSCLKAVLLGSDGKYTISADDLKACGGSPYHVKLIGVKTDEYTCDLENIFGDPEDATVGYEVTSPTTIEVVLKAKTAA
jgi:hypothetical protein